MGFNSGFKGLKCTRFSLDTKECTRTDADLQLCPEKYRVLRTRQNNLWAAWSVSEAAVSVTEHRRETSFQNCCISELQWMETVWETLGGNINTESSATVFLVWAGNSHKTLRLITLGRQQCEANHSNGQQSLYPPIQRPLITLRRYWAGAPYAT